MTFTVETSAGDEVARADTLAEAVRIASEALEDDPEVGGLDVWERPQDGSQAILRHTVTFGPDADWQSVVVVLEPGEKVVPPIGYSRFEREPEMGRLIEVDWNAPRPYDWTREGYDRNDPKHPNWYSVHVNHYDNREKTP